LAGVGALWGRLGRWLRLGLSHSSGRRLGRFHAGSGIDGLGRGVSFAEYFFECLEHDRLINWLRNVRRAV